MRDGSRVVNGENMLFELSIENSSDLKIKYGSDINSNDSITIKDYFNNLSFKKFAMYEANTDKTTVFYLDSILQNLNITKSSLESAGSYNVKMSDGFGTEYSSQMVAGQISAQYFNNSQYTDQQGSLTIIQNMQNGQWVQNKA